MPDVDRVGHLRFGECCDCSVTYASDTLPHSECVRYSRRMATRKTKFVSLMITVPARDLVRNMTYQRSLDMGGPVTQTNVVIAALALATEHADDHRRLITRLMTDQPMLDLGEEGTPG